MAITIWGVLMAATSFNYFTYNLLLYSYSPFSCPSDMDGFGHMTKPILWFQLYWTLGGALLVVAGSLLYSRGVSQSFKEKKQLARQRFQAITRTSFVVLLVAFLAVGAYLYIIVTYLNSLFIPWYKT